MTATLTSWKYYIIEPESATNLCTNPSIESNTTGWTLLNSTIAQSSEQARRGKCSLKVTPSSTALSGAYYALALTSGVTYSFSADIYTVAGLSYTIRVTDGSNNAVASYQFTGNGRWQRKSVSYTAASTATYRFSVVRNSGSSSTAAFYLDGALIKTGSDNLYFDGDTVDPYQATPQFYWTGTPHASASVRLASTRYGGTLLDISNYATVRAIQGMGLTTFETNTSSLALGGEAYQNSHANAREFSLVCLASTPLNSPYGTLQRKLARLEKAVNPKRMKVDQPMRLLIYGVDSAGVEASDPVLIDCIYEGGLEGDLSNRAPSFAMRFKMTDPLIKADGYNVTSLSPNTTVNGGTYGSLLMISEETGATEKITGFSSFVKGITPDTSGGMYIWGNFVNYGDANGDGIVYRNAAGSISSLGAGASGVQAAVFGVNGYLYVGSTSENMGGTAAADYIGTWDGAAWGALGTGLSAACNALAIDNAGNIYAGGGFVTAGGVTVNGLAKWDGSNWAALGGGTVGVVKTLRGVESIVVMPNNTIIFGGDFTQAGGSSLRKYLAQWDGASYSMVGGTAPNNKVNKLIYDKKSGRLYAFGAFTQIGGISASYAAFWDGNNWNPMAGKNAPTAEISYANLDDNGNVYAFITFPATSTVVYWNGSEWLLPEVENDKTINGIFCLSLTNQKAYLGYASSGSITYTVPAVSTINNATEGNIYPSITLDATGYYVYSLYNRSTGERIFLNGLQVYTGEKIELIFSPTGYTITSNIRGDMRSAVLSGSSPTFHLQPGTNYVSCFVYPSPTAAVTIPLKYPAAGYISLNETVYE